MHAAPPANWNHTRSWRVSEYTEKVELKRAREQVVRLARLLAVVVAYADGRIEIPYRHFDEFPGDVKLVEHYDAVNDCIVLRTGRPEENRPAEAHDPVTPGPSTAPTELLNGKGEAVIEGGTP